MRAILRWFLIAALGLGTLPAKAQVYPNIPANTVLGRLGAGQSGPPQAIPFTTFAPAFLSATTVSPNFPVIHPVTSNSGCATGHFLPWLDNNWCLSADAFVINSTDPSALLSFTPTGSPGNGTSTLTFTFGAGICSTGCTAATATTNAQSLTTVVANLVAAIKANVNLYNNVFGAQGQILAVSSSGTTLSLDFNSTVSMSVTFSDTASAITSHLPGSCASACTAALDTNPLFSVTRNSGAAPVAGSELFSLSASGTQSTSPTSVNTVYGQIAIKALNSTSGSIQGQIGFIAGDSAAADALYVSSGICTAAYVTGSGCAGVDSVNTGSYWVAGVEQILRTGGALELLTQSGDPIVLSPTGAGVGIGMTPTGLLDVNGQVSALAAGSSPTAGSGVTLKGGSTPIVTAENWGTSTTLPLAFVTNGTVSWGTAAGATPVLQSTNNGAPSGDTITVEGTHVILRGYTGTSLVNCGVSNTSSCSFIMAGSSSGTTTVVPTAAASGTLTLPATTDTVAVLGTFAAPPAIGNTTPAAGTFTAMQTTHALSSGSAPTCASTGIGSTGTCTLATGSNDFAGIVILTAGGSSIGSTGALTLTLNASLGANDAGCIAQAASGTGTWTAPVTFAWTTLSKTAPIVTWTNASTTLTSGSTYKVRYNCVGY